VVVATKIDGSDQTKQLGDTVSVWFIVQPTVTTVLNPLIGCTKVSPGCDNCYAEALANRFRGVANHPFEAGFKLRLVPDKLSEPLTWRAPRRVFTCSMSDLFHERVPLEYIEAVFQVMEKAPRHTFQVLTKRADRLAELASGLPWPKNVWAGVSVETSDYTSRVDRLLTVPARVRFLSLEPLLGPIPSLPLREIHWVIVGGESGPRARPMHEDWVRKIRETCECAGVPFFLKQLGGRVQKRGGDKAKLDGRLWHEYPLPVAPG
jgi:protein gp37